VFLQSVLVITSALENCFFSWKIWIDNSEVYTLSKIFCRTSLSTIQSSCSSGSAVLTSRCKQGNSWKARGKRLTM